MLIQVLSDLHLETEAFDPEPAAGAQCLVLAGDIDTTWQALARFKGWPVPVYFVPGNHEYDGRELHSARLELRRLSDALGLIWLDEAVLEHRCADGRRIRFLGTTRWCDFLLYGPAEAARAQRAAGYYLYRMNSRLGDEPLNAAVLQHHALRCRAWLADALAAPHAADATVVVTHYAPSLRSADPRYGKQPGTASFCNADDDLLPWADLWIHGHLHCRHNYLVEHAARRAHTQVLCNARGHGKKGEPIGFDGQLCIPV
jgi:predicted phosphodiesterase